MAELKDLLNEEQMKALEDAGFIVSTKEDHIPKSRFDEVNSRMKEAENKNAEYVKELENLNSSKGDVEALKKQIEEISTKAKSEQDAYESRIIEIQRKSLIDNALLKAGAKNIQTIWATSDLSKVAYKDGNIEGLEEIIKANKEANPYLWESEEKQVFKAGAPVGKAPAPDELMELTKLK